MRTSNRPWELRQIKIRVISSKCSQPPLRHLNPIEKVPQIRLWIEFKSGQPSLWKSPKEEELISKSLTFLTLTAFLLFYFSLNFSPFFVSFDFSLPKLSHRKQLYLSTFRRSSWNLISSFLFSSSNRIWPQFTSLPLKFARSFCGSRCYTFLGSFSALDPRRRIFFSYFLSLFFEDLWRSSEHFWFIIQYWINHGDRPRKYFSNSPRHFLGLRFKICRNFGTFLNNHQTKVGANFIWWLKVQS